MAPEIDKRILSYRTAMEAGLEHCKPYWEQYVRLYRLWHGKSFDMLDNTISKLMLTLHHSMVQDRIPKIMQNVFAGPQYISLGADSPEYQPYVSSAEMWLRDTLDDKIKMQMSIRPTLQTTLLGGSAFRMPHVAYIPIDGKLKQRIGSRDIDFLHVIPAPFGGEINPFDVTADEAVPWIMVIDYWDEDKIRSLAKQKVRGFDAEGIRRMLDRQANETFPEDSFKDAYGTVGNLEYGGPSTWRSALSGGSKQKTKRRIVHWFMRDKHMIIGEDIHVIYDGPPLLKHGLLPLVKYSITPDNHNFYGISYLELVEDIIKAIIMNFNMRMDHMLGSMFPVTWIRDDIGLDRPKSDFFPKPFDVQYFPTNVRNLRDAVYYDRRPEISRDTFMNEDAMKAFLQKLAGQPETTSSMENVVGNRTATGVTSILAELAGRPNMESTQIEHSGLREECLLLLTLAEQHITKPQYVPAPRSEDGFPWVEIDPHMLTDRYTVKTQGTKYMQEQSLTFSKLVAMYPFWNNKETWNQYELDHQVAEITGVIPDPGKAINPEPPPQPMAPALAGAGVGAPGGLGSQMDMGQRTRSQSNRTSVPTNQPL